MYYAFLTLDADDDFHMVYQAEPKVTVENTYLVFLISSLTYDLLYDKLQATLKAITLKQLYPETEGKMEAMQEVIAYLIERAEEQGSYVKYGGNWCGEYEVFDDVHPLRNWHVCPLVRID